MKTVLIMIIIGGCVMSSCSPENASSPDTTGLSELYQCSICKLHFETKKMADKCDDWCQNNNSCNVEIAGQSIEARQGKYVDEDSLSPHSSCCLSCWCVGDKGPNEGYLDKLLRAKESGRLTIQQYDTYKSNLLKHQKLNSSQKAK